MNYCKLSKSGRAIPSVEYCSELEWKLRYSPSSITVNDMFVIAHYLSQYQAFHEYTNKQRNTWFREYKELYN